MNKFNKIIKKISEDIINLFSYFLLQLLIWVGAIMGLVESGNDFLAILLLLSGGAWAYKNSLKLKEKKK